MSGSGGGGGYQYQAQATAFIATHILAKQPLHWIEHFVGDIPTIVAEETNGPGDDIRITLRDGSVLEVQAKHGLKKNEKFWEAIIKLTRGLVEDPALYGVLLTDSTASSTIRDKLREDIIRLGQGLEDDLKAITQEVIGRLRQEGISHSSDIFKRLRIVIADLDNSQRDAKTALGLLPLILKNPEQAGQAWKVLSDGGLDLIKKRGQRDAESLFRLLGSNGLQLSPVTNLEREVDWQETCRGMLDQHHKAKENYLKQLRSYFNNITFEGVDLEEHEGSQPKELTQIFVIPYLKAEPVLSAHKELPDQREQKLKLIAASELFKNDKIRSVLLLGAPGSGKTVLISYFVLMLCGQNSEPLFQSLPADRAKPQPDRIGLPNEIDWLPIVIRIRDLARHPEMSILEFTRYFAENTLSCSPLPHDFFEYWLKNGRALIFLDGLDEVVKDQQSILVERINLFLSQYDQNRVLITSRPAGNPGYYFRTEDFPRYEIQPFDNRQIDRFIHRWYDNHCLDKTEADRSKSSLRRTLNANDRIKLLARNPLLLTIILLIHRDHVQLPKERCELYDCAIKTLLNSWDENKALSNHTVLQYLNRDDLRWLMAQLAYWIHTQGKTSAEEGTLIERDDLVEQISTYIQDEKKVRPDQAEAEAKRFLDQIVRDRAGLLSKQGDGYAFVHKTFQEYLTAENLCSQAKKPDEFERLLHEVRSQLNNPHWNEVILLLVAQLTGKEAAQMLQAILQRNSDYERWLHRDLLFVGRCLAENSKKLWQEKPQIITEILTQLIKLEITDDICVVWKIKQQIPSILLSLNGTCFSMEALRILKSYSSEIPPMKILLYRLVLGEHQEVVNNFLSILKDKQLFASGLEILEKVVKHSNISDSLIQHLCSEFQGEIGIAKALRSLGYEGELRDYIDHILMIDDYEEMGQNMAYEKYMKQQTEEAEAIYSEVEPLLDELRSGSILTIDSLIEWLNYDEYGVSEHIAKELGQASHTSQLIKRKLLEKLHDESSWGRSNTVQALGYLSNPSEDAISTLIALLHHDKDGFVRASAAKVLSAANVSHDTVLSHLLNSFRDLSRCEDSYTEDLYFNSEVSEALVQLSKSFNPVVPALAQWIEQNQDKEYVEYGIDALLKMVGEY